MASFKKSLYDWCIENNRQDILELWDYKLNKCNPKEVSYRTGKKYYFKCPRGIHKSELKCIDNLVGKNMVLRCNQCNSFGQYLIDTFGEDALKKYWDYYKNVVNPFEISKSCAKKVWIFCQNKDYHGSYEISCNDFYNGRRCSYCRNNKVHPKDSFAQYHIDNTDPNFLEKYWSKKNTIDPFTIAPCSMKNIWVICQNDEEHEDYKITCDNFTKGRRCGNCRESYGERAIAKWLNNENVKYIREKTFPNLLGVGSDCLRYDFYLPEYNMLVEYQGKQHYEPQDFKNEGDKKAYENFIRQQEHDRRKREYAESHDIKLLEIWYWDFNNITEILNKELGLS